MGGMNLEPMKAFLRVWWGLDGWEIRAFLVAWVLQFAGAAGLLGCLVVFATGRAWGGWGAALSLGVVGACWGAMIWLAARADAPYRPYDYEHPRQAMRRLFEQERGGGNDSQD